MLRPAWFFALKIGESLISNRRELRPAQVCNDPPMGSGTFAASALSTMPDEVTCRDAAVSALNVGADLPAAGQLTLQPAAQAPSRRWGEPSRSCNPSDFAEVSLAKASAVVAHGASARPLREGTVNGSVVVQPSASLDRLTSSAPNASPCALAVPARLVNCSQSPCGPRSARAAWSRRARRRRRIERNSRSFTSSDALHVPAVAFETPRCRR